MATDKSLGDTAPLERLTPAEFRAEVVRKGWTFVAIGRRWDMSANWLQKVAGNAQRPRYWDDAIRGLPDRAKGE